MSDITTRPGTAVATPESNPFIEESSQIIGKLLKFSKGDYLAGQDNEDVPLGTRFIADMNNYLVGWIRWEDGKPAEHRMGRKGDGYQPPPRSALGYDDQSKWEIDESNGKPRDPWQASRYLVLKMVAANNTPLRSEDGEDGDDLYTFTTSSKGGIDELKKLSNKYGQSMRQHPDEWPVIEIGGDFYDHPDKKFGRIKTPVLKLVGWVPKDRFLMDEPEPEDEPQQALPLHKEPMTEGSAPKPRGGTRF